MEAMQRASKKAMDASAKSRLDQYKILQSIPLGSPQLDVACDRIIAKLNTHTETLASIISDLSADQESLRYGSSYLFGKLFDQTMIYSTLKLSSSQRSDVISALVLALSNVPTDGSTEAGQLMWTLRRDGLVMLVEMTPHVVSLLYACQRAVTDVKSSLANRASYAVAVGALQLIFRLYTAQLEAMQDNTKIWFSVVVTYCSHGESRLLRVHSMEVIEAAYDHLIQEADTIRSIVSGMSETIIANITNILWKQYDEPSKLFAIKLWGLLVTIMGRELEKISTTNLYLSALTKAFSKSYPDRQAEAFIAWKLLIQNMSTEYLMKPVVRKQLAVPLTKSNRVEELQSLRARFDCWWVLIRRLGATLVEGHFNEICKPLFEFCVATGTGRTANSTGLSNPNMVRVPGATTTNLLQKECLAITLQFFGQYDAVVIEGIELGDDQRNVVLSTPIISHCGKVLIQAMSESFSYIKNTGDRNIGIMISLLKAFASLTFSVIQFSNEQTRSEPVRGVVRRLLSVVMAAWQHVPAKHMVDLVGPVVNFSKDILSSTAYTPADINSITKNPSSCMLEILLESVNAEESSADARRRGDCICRLIEKGFTNFQSASMICTYLDGMIKKLKVPNIENKNEAGVASAVILCAAGIIHKGLEKINLPMLIDAYVPIHLQMATKIPLTSLCKWLSVIQDGLLKMLKQEHSSRSQIVGLWKVICERLSSLKALDTDIVPMLIRLLDTTLKHSNHALRGITMKMWEETLSKYCEDNSINSIAIRYLRPLDRRVDENHISEEQVYLVMAFTPLPDRQAIDEVCKRRVKRITEKINPSLRANSPSRAQQRSPSSSAAFSPSTIAASPKTGGCPSRGTTPSPTTGGSPSTTMKPPFSPSMLISGTPTSTADTQLGLPSHIVGRSEDFSLSVKKAKEVIFSLSSTSSTTNDNVIGSTLTKERAMSPVVSSDSAASPLVSSDSAASPLLSSDSAASPLVSKDTVKSPLASKNRAAFLLATKGNTVSPLALKGKGGRSTRKRLITDSPSRSPSKSVNKRQLILSDSLSIPQSDSEIKLKNPVNELVPTTPESFHLLNGLITPEKRQEDSERTPDKPVDFDLSVPSPVKIRQGLLDFTPTNSSAAETKDSAIPDTKGSPELNNIDEELAIPLVLTSQRIEGSPPASQIISQLDGQSSSQEISQDSANMDEPISVSIAIDATPKQPMRTAVTAHTPGYPVTSPMVESFRDAPVSQQGHLTPVRLAADSSQIDTLVPCSVKITRFKLSDAVTDPSLPAIECSVLHPGKISQLSTGSQVTVIDSQGSGISELQFSQTAKHDVKAENFQIMVNSSNGRSNKSKGRSRGDKSPDSIVAAAPNAMEDSALSLPSTETSHMSIDSQATVIDSPDSDVSDSPRSRRSSRNKQCDVKTLVNRDGVNSQSNKGKGRSEKPKSSDLAVNLSCGAIEDNISFASAETSQISVDLKATVMDSQDSDVSETQSPRRSSRTTKRDDGSSRSNKGKSRSKKHKSSDLAVNPSSGTAEGNILSLSSTETSQISVDSQATVMDSQNSDASLTRGSRRSSRTTKRDDDDGSKTNECKSQSKKHKSSDLAVNPSSGTAEGNIFSLSSTETSQISIDSQATVMDSQNLDVSGTQTSRKSFQNTKDGVKTDHSQNSVVESSDDGLKADKSRGRWKKDKLSEENFSSSPLIMRVSRAQSVVKMVANTKVTVHFFSKVKVIKSRKSNVKRLTDDLCESQDSSEPNFESGPETIVVSSQVNTKTKELKPVRSRSKRLAKDPAETEDSTIKVTAEKPPETIIISSSQESAIDISEIQKNCVTMEVRPSSFDSLPTHESFFDTEIGDENLSLPHDKIMGSLDINSSSLQFLSLSGNSTTPTESEVVTPIPPRFISESVELQSSQSVDEVESQALSGSDPSTQEIYDGSQDPQDERPACVPSKPYNEERRNTSGSRTRKNAEDLAELANKNSSPDTAKRSGKTRSASMRKWESDAIVTTTKTSGSDGEGTNCQSGDRLNGETTCDDSGAVSSQSIDGLSSEACNDDNKISCVQVISSSNSETIVRSTETEVAEDGHGMSPTDIDLSDISVSTKVSILQDLHSPVSSSKTVNVDSPQLQSNAYVKEESTDTELINSIDVDSQLMSHSNKSPDFDLTTTDSIKSHTDLASNIDLTSDTIKSHSDLSPNIDLASDSIKSHSDLSPNIDLTTSDSIKSHSDLSPVIDLTSDSIKPRSDISPDIGDSVNVKGSPVANTIKVENNLELGLNSQNDIGLSQFEDEMLTQDWQTKGATAPSPNRIKTEDQECFSDDLPSLSEDENSEQKLPVEYLNSANAPCDDVYNYDPERDSTSVVIVKSEKVSLDSAEIPNSVSEIVDLTKSVDSKRDVRFVKSSNSQKHAYGNLESTASTSAFTERTHSPSTPNSKLMACKTESMPSPSRAQKMLMLSTSSRSSQILARSISSKAQSQQSSPSGMSHVDTLPATPRSHKLNAEALSLDCTPLYSPGTGSILKRKRHRSPSNSSLSKKVKFCLPGVVKKPSSEKKKEKQRNDQDILAMYSPEAIDVDDFNEDGDKQKSSESQSNSSSSQSQTLSQLKEPPLAPDYSESTLSIEVLVPYLASDIWQGNLQQCLVSQGITTVGALAQLTETEIELLPIRGPKISTTLKAFKKSGATKNPPKATEAASKPKGPSKTQLEAIMKMVAAGDLSDTELGGKIRDLLVLKDDGITLPGDE